MAEPFLAEIRIFSFNFAPKGWALCNGQTMPINQNQALFSLLGTTYGGDGRTTFALPNLQGRTPIHFGGGVVLGESSGEETHTLTLSEMPTHTHSGIGSGNAADQQSPAGSVWAVTPSNAYSSNLNGTMSPAAVGSIGGNQPHQNLSPYTVLNFCVALQGIFPSRN